VLWDWTTRLEQTGHSLDAQIIPKLANFSHSLFLFPECVGSRYIGSFGFVRESSYYHGLPRRPSTDAGLDIARSPSEHVICLRSAVPLTSLTKAVSQPGMGPRVVFTSSLAGIPCETQHTSDETSAGEATISMSPCQMRILVRLCKILLFFVPFLGGAQQKYLSTSPTPREAPRAEWRVSLARPRHCTSQLACCRSPLPVGWVGCQPTRVAHTSPGFLCVCCCCAVCFVPLVPLVPLVYIAAGKNITAHIKHRHASARASTMSVSGWLRERREIPYSHLGYQGLCARASPV